MSDAEQIKADIEQTRRELAETVSAVAEKLNPKVQTRKYAHEATDEFAQRYARARDAAPEPVQRALATIEEAAAPVVEKARSDPQRAVKVVVGALVVLVVIRRSRRRRRIRSRA